MIVFPMAGKSTRFREAGYRKDKFRLPLLGRPMLWWVVRPFARYAVTEEFMFISRRDQGSRDVVESVLEDLGIVNWRLIELDAGTRGQAETVFKGVQGRVSDAVPLTIFNVDTIRRSIRLPANGEHSWFETFEAEGDHWSFAELMPGTRNRVKRTVEKVRVSNLCSTGLYGFPSIEAFCEAYESSVVTGSQTEIYVAPLFNRLIEGGIPVHTVHVSDASQVIPAGTPAEYRSLVANPASLELLLT